MFVLFRLLLVLGVSVISIGCSASLYNVEREASIDKEEVANGWRAGNGNYYKREKNLAADEILCRSVNVKAHQGYLVQVVNYSSDLVFFTIKRKGKRNPVTASFYLKPMSEMEYRLPIGNYDVHCSWGDGKNDYNWSRWDSGEWSDVWKVTSAPVITNISGKERRYHAIIGNIDAAHRASYYSGRY